MDDVQEILLLSLFFLLIACKWNGIPDYVKEFPWITNHLFFSKAVPCRTKLEQSYF